MLIKTDLIVKPVTKMKEFIAKAILLKDKPMKDLLDETPKDDSEGSKESRTNI